MGRYSPEILAESDRRGVHPYAVYKEKKEQELMAQTRKTAAEEPATFGERLVAATLGTLGLLYLIYLAVDILMGWGNGFAVLFLALGALAVIAAVSAIVALWRWVYKGSGRYQMSKS